MFSLPNSSRFFRRGWWLVILLSLLALILSHWIALIYRVQPEVSLWFPTSGVAIALALWFGPTGVILTALAAMLMAPLWGIEGWGRLVGLADGIEPLVAWLLYRRFAKGWLSFKRLSDAAAFIISGPIVSSGMTAVIGSLTLVGLKHISMSSLATTIPNWWLGNALGTMSIAPTALLVLTSQLQSKGWVLPPATGESQESSNHLEQQAQDYPPPCLLPQRYRAEITGILLLSIISTSIAVWEAHRGSYLFQQVSFLSFVPIVWAACRFGVSGGMLVSTFCVLTTLIDYILLYPNVLALPSFPLSAELLQTHKLSLFVQCTVSLLVGCAATERAATQVALVVQQVRAVEYEARARLSDRLLVLNNELTQANIRLQESHNQLHSREQEFKALAENSPDAIVRFDREFRLVYVNSALERETRIPPEVFTGKTLSLLGFPLEKRLHWQTVIQEVFDTGAEREVEFDVPFSEGIRYYQSRVVPEFSPDGAIVSVLSVTRNITNLKQTEAALRRSEARLRRLVDSNLIGVIFANLKGNLIGANQAFLQMLGYSQAEITSGKLRWDEMTPPEYRQQDEAVIAELKLSGICKPFEKVYIAKDGSYVPVLVGVAMLEGTQEECIAFVLDLTERKQAEREKEQLLARERHYSSQLHGLTEAAVAIDSALSVDQVLKVITEQARSIIGAHQSVTSMTVDKNWREAINRVSLSDKYAQWQDYQETTDGTGIYAWVCQINRPVRMTQEVLEKHPKWRGFGKEAQRHPPLRGWLAAPLKARDGSNIGLIQLSDKYQGDFTQEDEAILVQLAEMASVAIENARLYEAEQNARAQAENANRIKDEFLAVLSHELRSPLNPILGWVKLLRTRKFDPEKTDRALETIERNTRLQSQLIDDLLDVSRILRGKLSLQVTQVNLGIAIQAAMETVRLAAEAKSIDLKFSVLNDRDNINLNTTSQFLVKGDSNRLQQIVWNLLSNAIKFTPEQGRVEVKLSIDPKEKGKFHSPIAKYAQIQVVDTGKGISKEFLPYVFEHFRQADSSITRQYGGLGLGLAIVRNLVEMHGGTIQAESQGEGMGATFTVKLPLLKHEVVRTNEQLNSGSLTGNSSLAGRRILVVDDEPDTRELIAFVLEENGAEIKIAASAFEVLEILDEFRPNLLVCDIGMPEKDGYTLIREVRSNEKIKNIPAIALTAYASEQDKKTALAAGFQLHLSKPVDTGELVKAIANLLSSKA